ncbi:MAG: antitoxin [Salinibacterium sp.]|nr:MAG: antitoxin [Salinibacterium sp.]
MVKMTLDLPDAVKRGIARIARERGVAEAQVIRESLQRTIAEARLSPRGGFIEGEMVNPINWNTNEHLAGFGER